MEAATITAAERQKELQPVVEAWVEQVGGWSLIRARDIVRVLMMRHPDLWKNIVSGDSSMGAFLGRVAGANVGNDTLDAIEELSREINESDDPRAYFFGLVREASGLVNAPLSGGSEWPFRVELVPLSNLYADDRYQRPVDDAFVRKTVLAYDASLVGTIDVAQTEQGHAIMDGRQRFASTALVGKTAMWCSIYENLELAEQARFFHHKNRDRKNVHPYYHFRARLVAGDPDAKAINRIVKRHGYKLGIGALDDDVITSIKSAEEVFGWTSEHRDNALDPTLEKMRRMWYGVQGGKEGTLIRGLGRFFAVYSDDEINWQHVEDQLAAIGPRILQGRAKDLVTRGGMGSHSIGVAVARAIVTFHNTGQARAKRLDPARLFMAARSE